MAGRRKTDAAAWLGEQARPARRLHARIVLLGMLGTAAAVLQAWCIARLLAPALGAPARGAFGWAAGFAGLAALRAGLGYAGDRLGFEAGAAVRRRLRTMLFSRLFAQGPSVVDRASPGMLGALAVDGIEALDAYFGRWLPAAALAVAAPALVAVAVLVVDPLAGLVLCVAGLLVPAGMALAGLGAAAAARDQFVAMGRLQARFLDRVRGIATIVLAGQAEAEARRLRDSADELTRRTLRVLRVAFLSSATLDAAAAAALVLLAIRFGVEASAGPLPVPARAVFPLLLVAEFFAPLRAFAAAYQDRLQAGEVSGQMAAAQPKEAAPSAPLPVRTVRATGVTVAFENVSLTRDPKRGPVLDGLSFRVPAGETAVLVGPSGAGKTTVMELLLGFLRPDGGRITLNGAELASITPQALSRMTAWIGQRPVLFAGSIRDNIRFGRDDASDEDVAAAAKAAGLQNLLAALPFGLDTGIGEQGYGLSGGQAQRLALARAMLARFPVLVLDEPTASVDPARADALLRDLTDAASRSGSSVVLISHAPVDPSLVDRVVTIEDGRLSAI